jgi:hypothetical protein
MSKSKKAFHNYAKYSSIAIQMGVIIFGGAYGGTKLDEYVNIDFPLFTVLLTIFSVVMAIYLAVKDVLKKPKK